MTEVPPDAYADATELFEVYTRNHDWVTLERAIAAYEQALDGADGFDQLNIANDLGIAYRHQFESRPQPDILRRAVALHEACLQRINEVLASEPVDDPAAGVSAAEVEQAQLALKSTALNNLGFDHRLMFETWGNLTDLNAAIDLLSESASVAPFESQVAQANINLGACLLAHYKVTTDPDSLRRSLEVLSTTAIPTEANDAAWWHSNLAQCLYERYRLTGDGDDGRNAVTHFREAFELGRGQPFYSQMANNYAAALVYGVGFGEGFEGLIRALTILNNLLARTDSSSLYRAGFLANLALAYSGLSGLERYPYASARASKAFRQACAAALDGLPGTAVSIGYSWGDWASRAQQWSEAADGYSAVVQAVRLLFEGQWTRGHKETWLRTLSRAPHLAAFAHARAGDVQAAVVSVESGRALLLSEALGQQDATLRELSAAGRNDLRVAYQEAANRWSNASRVADAWPNLPE